jgi:tetratricopeptide (TPR) repeat protein
VQLNDVTGDDIATEAESPALETTLPAPPEMAPPLVQSAEAPPPEAEPTPARVTASQPEVLSEHELTAPDVSIAEDAGAPAFDLAAELSEALVDGAPATRAGASTDQDGFSSLFSEFKRGVSRTLGEGDVETHFDLGIAYREMGLLDDAIGEFHYALGSTARRLDALHMMGLCALDVGRAIDAIGHLEQALASPDVPAERETALRFDLGRAHEAQGDCDRALDAFRRVAELDAEFQDVGARIEALLSGLAAAHADAAEESAEGEAYEAFDDLVAKAAEEAPVAAPEEPALTESYENFEEFMSDDTEDSAGETGDADASDASAVRDHAEPVVAAPEVAVEIESPQPPDAEPEPPVGAPRRRKVSFF